MNRIQPRRYRRVMIDTQGGDQRRCHGYVGAAVGEW
jgi:hypothetical protein